MKINALKERVFNFTEKFASKTGDYAIITKLTMEIKTFETKVSSLHEQLGKAVYEKMKEDSSSVLNDEVITGLIQKIDDYMSKITNINEEISEIRKKAEEAKKSRKKKEEDKKKTETKEETGTEEKTEAPEETEEPEDKQ